MRELRVAKGPRIVRTARWRRSAPTCGVEQQVQGRLCVGSGRQRHAEMRKTLIARGSPKFRMSMSVTFWLACRWRVRDGNVRCPPTLWLEYHDFTERLQGAFRHVAMQARLCNSSCSCAAVLAAPVSILTHRWSDEAACRHQGNQHHDRTRCLRGHGNTIRSEGRTPSRYFLLKLSEASKIL